MWWNLEKRFASYDVHAHIRFLLLLHFKKQQPQRRFAGFGNNTKTWPTCLPESKTYIYYKQQFFFQVTFHFGEDKKKALGILITWEWQDYLNAATCCAKNKASHIWLWAMENCDTFSRAFEGRKRKYCFLRQKEIWPPQEKHLWQWLKLRLMLVQISVLGGEMESAKSMLTL